MASNQNVATDNIDQENLGIILKTSKETMFLNFPKLNDLNWEKWSRGTIRNLKARRVTYLFKGLKEEEFVNAMELEKSEDDKMADIAEAFGIIRAGLHERDLGVVENSDNVTKCWTSLKERYNGSTHRRHFGILSNIKQDMEWQEDDTASKKWFNLRDKMEDIPGLESLTNDTTMGNFVIRIIIDLWISRLPSHIAKIFEKNVRQGAGTWNEVMMNIDDDIAMMPKSWKAGANKEPAKTRYGNKNQPRPTCQFCNKVGHTEDVCRNKASWDNRKINANMSFMDNQNKDGLYTIPCTETMEPNVKMISYEDAHVKFGHAGTKPDDFHCQTCVKGKITKTNGHSHTLTTQEPLDLIHMDISGNHPIGINKAQYYIIVVDDATKYKWAIPIQNRKDAPSVLNEWKKKIELKMGKTIKAVRTDNAAELKKLTLQWQSQYGSDAQFTIPGTSSQNGVAERAIRTVNDSIRTMLEDSQMPTKFWPYAAIHSAYMANRASISNSKSPFELFFSIAPNAMHIHRWGCKIIFHNAYNKNPAMEQRNKLEARGKEGILLLIDENVSGRYTCWDIEKRKPRVTESLKFFEDIAGGTILRSTKTNREAPTSENTTNTVQDTNQILVQEKEMNNYVPETAEEIHEEEEGPENQIHDNEPEMNHEANNVDHDMDMEIDDQETDTVTVEDTQLETQREDIDTNKTDEMIPEQELEITNEDTPDKVQERINRTLNDLYLKGILKRPYTQIQNDQEDDENPTTKRIRTMVTKMAEREPGNYQEAINHPTHALEWKQAIDTELKTLREFNTWTRVPFEKGMKPVNTKFVFKIKPSRDNQPEKFKARLVAQGFKQIRGVDYHETYAPTPKQTTTRTFFAIVCELNLKCRKVDATNAFAQAKLEETVHIIPPPPLQEKGMVWRLNKALYGLKQASYTWRNKIVRRLSQLGLIPSTEDECIMADPNGGIMVLIYVDDIAIAGPDESKIRKFIEALSRTIDIKDMGELTSFLGMEVSRDKKNRKLWLTQTGYIQKMAEEFDMAACRARPISAPISSWETLEPRRPEEKGADKGLYQSLIGTLMYPSVMTRPDIAFATSSLSQHITDPAERHLEAAKRVARYLRDTASLGIEFDSSRRGGTNELLVGYSDADYANSKDRKSVSGMIYTLAGGPIQWKSQKQRSVATSTTEAEYVGFTPCAKEGIWIHRLVKWCLEMMKSESILKKSAQTINLRDSTLVFGDNQAALKIANNLGASSKTKHIDVQYHAIKEWIREGKIKLEYVSTEKMLADGFTKPLNAQKFKTFRSDINIRSVPDGITNETPE
ncbi:Retrovirus-related Pol polyprotein from transposon TNT 1-94 [Ceratocystis lukuohia]|uniref:Retrovirus-related Pol polyprotein from transposon TNT 1-94 n=1 Tax=Ceratocystis lukuohia TaxID=2019550 RepID=A0ABR4MEW1_9PEZI